MSAQSATGASRRINPLYIVLGAVVAAVVVTAVLLNFVFVPADDFAVPEFTPVPRPPTTPEPTPEPTEVFEIFEGRDPFRPLIFETPATPEPPPAPPNGIAPPGVTPTPGAPAPPPAAPTPRPGVQVELLSVADDGSSATVRVGAQVHENARPGQTLSADVVVVSIDGRCASFRRGSDSFRLCVGDFVIK